MYGIFLDVSDWEFNCNDILIRDKNGKFYIFKSKSDAKAYLSNNDLDNSNDGYGHGRDYHIEKIELLEEEDEI